MGRSEPDPAAAPHPCGACWIGNGEGAGPQSFPATTSTHTPGWSPRNSWLSAAAMRLAAVLDVSSASLEQKRANAGSRRDGYRIRWPDTQQGVPGAAFSGQGNALRRLNIDVDTCVPTRMELGPSCSATTSRIREESAAWPA